eukprot:scaffold267_cov489-Pavlova_lutheri.AAC.2
MSGEYPHSTAASLNAEDHVSNLHRSLSVPFTARMCIALRGPHGPQPPRTCTAETRSWSLRDSTSQGPGLEQPQHIVSILDEKSKVGVAKPICNKSQAAAVIKTVIRMMEKQTGNAMKFVRSVRGTEFLNAELQNF